jgi:hypothetical protein
MKTNSNAAGNSAPGNNNSNSSSSVDGGSVSMRVPLRDLGVNTPVSSLATDFACTSILDDSRPVEMRGTTLFIPLCRTSDDDGDAGCDFEAAAQAGVQPRRSQQPRGAAAPQHVDDTADDVEHLDVDFDEDDDSNDVFQAPPPAIMDCDDDRGFLLYRRDKDSAVHNDNNDDFEDEGLPLTCSSSASSGSDASCAAADESTVAELGGYSAFNATSTSVTVDDNDEGEESDEVRSSSRCDGGKLPTARSFLHTKPYSPYSGVGGRTRRIKSESAPLRRVNSLPVGEPINFFEGVMCNSPALVAPLLLPLAVSNTLSLSPCADADLSITNGRSRIEAALVSGLECVWLWASCCFFLCFASTVTDG